jgi:hypothetical protein
MHSSWPSWPKGTDSRWARGSESRWTRGTDSRWTRNTDSRWSCAEMLAAHGGPSALKTTTAKATTAVAAATGEAATAKATTAVAAATGEAATAKATTAVAAATGEAATAKATTAVATATATAEATTAMAAATASLCKGIGRGEGDANCRHSGKKKSDLSAHGTSPRIGIAPCKFNTTHAKLFRSRNVASGLFFFRRSHDHYDLLRQFSPQAGVYARHTCLIEEDVYTAFPELKPEGPFSFVWRRAPQRRMKLRMSLLGT